MLTKLLLTGGTIDKNYNEFNGELNFIETHMPELLAVGRDRADISIQQLMMKDSPDMTDEEMLNQVIETSSLGLEVHDGKIRNLLPSDLEEKKTITKQNVEIRH